MHILMSVGTSTLPGEPAPDRWVRTGADQELPAGAELDSGSSSPRCAGAGNSEGSQCRWRGNAAMSTVSGAGILPRPAGKSCFAGKSLPATGRRPAPRSTSVRKTGCPPPAPACPGGRASPATGSPDGGPARGTPVEVALPRVHARPP